MINKEIKVYNNDENFKQLKASFSEMDFLPNLLDPTNPLHNMTLLTNTFIGAFFGTFLANLGAQTVRHILGESDV